MAVTGLEINLNLPFFLNRLFAYNVCCIYSNALKNTFTVGENPMNPDQTAPKGRV